MAAEAAEAYLVRSVEPLSGAAQVVRREGAEAAAWGPRLQVCMCGRVGVFF